MKPAHMLAAAAAVFVLYRLYSANASKDSMIGQLQRRLKKQRADSPTDEADEAA